MKISCLQENLSKGLSIVGRAVASRSSLPVLSNVMLSTDEGRLRLAATNLEIGINCWVGAKILEDGATTVSGAAADRLRQFTAVWTDRYGPFCENAVVERALRSI